MMLRILSGGLILSIGLLSGPQVAVAAIAGLQQIVGTGLSSPAFATHAPGDNDRLFIAELGGDIEIIDLNTNTVTANFLNIPGVDSGGSEGGLLGLAFHPDYFHEGETGFGKFYVYVTLDNTLPENVSPFSSHIREYQVNPDNPNQAIPTPVREIMVFTQPQANHNAGWIGFNPAVTAGQPQYLYISSGDGGNGWDMGPGHSELPDASGNAQDLTDNFLGKMLRVDVDGEDAYPNDDNLNYAIPPTNPFVGQTGDDEIWAYGLRNPFRDSFDRVTGDLWIGDVGQGQREEIDFQPAGSPGGENYGWRFREGTVTTNNGVGGPDLDEYTDPIYDYGRGGGDFLGETVIGGYVYRGPDPDLQGLYFFGDADQNNDNVWTLERPDSGPVVVDNINAELGSLFDDIAPDFGRIGSFGEDNQGNLYLVDLFGAVYRIVTDNLIAGDYNADGKVDDEDYAVWKADFGSTEKLDADGNGNEVVDAADYTVWRDNFGNTVHNLGGSGAVSVPEPASMTLALFAIAALYSVLSHNAINRTRSR